MEKVDRKIGRNERCPCGSGRKFKHCHGSHASPPRTNQIPKEALDGLKKAFREREATEFRRRQQQGLGRPIVSFEADGHRLVAVGNTVFWSKKWKTFHDFLFDYIKHVFGAEWGLNEQKKPLVERHILMRWNHEIGQHFAAHSLNSPEGQIRSGPATPVLRAYMNLAYNLYLIRHNAKLQGLLVTRLKSRDESSFHGAYYETFVAGSFIKAGFEIEFENEQDGSSSHCEFTATNIATKKRFSVEAKSRYRSSVGSSSGSQLKLGVRDKLESALQKKAHNERVVFIDVNLLEEYFEGIPSWIPKAVNEIRDVENTMKAAGQNTPEAYVLVTNHPYQYEGSQALSAVMEGFNIPEWKMGVQFRHLREAVDARERHQEMKTLFESLQKHYDIPATFDGEMPDHAFKMSDQPPLKIGERYLVPDSDGVEKSGVLEHATMVEGQKLVYGVYHLDNGKRVIVTTPVTDDELSAYRKFPETFFGNVDRNAGRKARDILDLYDFFFDSYRNTPKEKLLEFMDEAPDIETLRTLSQPELARFYCEQLAYSANRGGMKGP
jgi:hypothetical protein